MTIPGSETPLLWAGGKRWLVPHLLKLWRPHAGRQLVEPFCGALSVALGLRPKRALLNDANPHLVGFFHWVQNAKPPRARMRFDNDERRFYVCRRRFNALAAGNAMPSKPDEAAELFYYLNRTCYGGLFRLNSDGEFNVPFGRRRAIRYVRDFSALAATITGWTFTAGDFGAVEIDPDAFLYADPPYDVPFTRYTAAGFSWPDQERLALLLRAHPGPVVASNQATRRVLKLYRSLGFDVRIIDGPRRINSNGDRTPAREMLATRNV